MGDGIHVRGAGSSASLTGVAVENSGDRGILVLDGGAVAVAVQGGRIAGSRGNAGVLVNGAGSRASLTGVAVENSGQFGIWAETDAVVSLDGGSVSGSGSGDYYQSRGGRIELRCPRPDHAGEQLVRRSELVRRVPRRRRLDNEQQLNT